MPSCWHKLCYTVVICVKFQLSHPSRSFIKCHWHPVFSLDLLIFEKACDMYEIYPGLHWQKLVDSISQLETYYMASERYERKSTQNVWLATKRFANHSNQLITKETGTGLTDVGYVVETSSKCLACEIFVFNNDYFVYFAPKYKSILYNHIQKYKRN